MRLPPALLSRPIRWTAAALILGCFVVVPFMLFGARLELWSIAMMQASDAIAMVAGLFLLVADVLLPVPSSFVLTALGTTLGAVAGTVVGALGLTIGCCVAYALGYALGPERAQNLVHAGEQERLVRLFDRHGVVLLAACRAVPVLAEASILVAGILRLPLRRVLMVTTAANVGVGGGYAMLGATASDALTFAAAFLAAILVPALAIAAAKAGARANGSDLHMPDAGSLCAGETVPKEDAYGR